MAALTAALLLLGACTDNVLTDDNAPNTPSSADVILSVGFDAPHTRMGFEDDALTGVKLTWTAGDAFSLYNAEGNWAADFDLVSGEGTDNGKFKMRAGSNGLYQNNAYTAVYPATATDDHYLTLGQLTSDLSWATQHGTSGTGHLDQVSFLQGGYTHTSASAGSFNFEHSHALLTLTLQTPAAYTSGAPVELAYVDGDKSYHLQMDGIADMNSDITVYFPVEAHYAPAPKRDVRVEIVLDNGELYISKLNTDKAYDAGKRYTATFRNWNRMNGWKLTEFNASAYPTTDVWVVTDDNSTAGSDAEFYGIRAALRTVYESTPDRKITVVMPNLTKLPAGAFQAQFGSSALSSFRGPVVEEIGENAFNYCQKMAVVAIPKVKTIGTATFYDCIKLTSVNIPLLEKMPEEAFAGCARLTRVVAPLITEVGGGAFSGCSKLNSADYPLAETIEYSGFNECRSLPVANFPAATFVGETAFRSCTSLTTVDLSAATEIGRQAFIYADAITSLTIATRGAMTSVGDDQIPENVAKNIDLIVGEAEYAAHVEGLKWREYGPFKSIQKK